MIIGIDIDDTLTDIRDEVGENILPLYLKKPQAQIQLEAKLKSNI